MNSKYSDYGFLEGGGGDWNGAKKKKKTDKKNYRLAPLNIGNFVLMADLWIWFYETEKNGPVGSFFLLALF